MTAGHLPRRLVVGACSAALLAGAVGVVPLLGSASAACTPTYTDPAGDAVLVADGLAVPGGPTLGNDEDFDILDVTHTVDAGTFSTVLHMKALADFGPQISYVDEFVSHFTVNGKAVDVTARRSHSMLTGDETDTGTLTVAGTDTTVPVKVVVDLKASTVTTQIAAPAFETALGGALAGKPFSAMSAESLQVFNISDLDSPGLADTMDEATAPTAAAYGYGASCSGDVTPGPTGSGTPGPTGSASPTPTASPSPTTPASGGLFDQPRKGCFDVKDVAGDADPTPTGLDNEDALDITQLNLKSPYGALQLYVALADPSAELFPTFSGPVYDVALTIGGKTVTLSAPGTGPATAKVGTAANSDIKATAKVDTKAKNIVFTVPLAGLSKATATVIKRGTPITNAAASTAADSLVGPQAADATAALKTYAYGDNRCFVPPPGAFTLDADRTGQYGDRTLVFATLNDADGSPVPGVNVTGILTGGRAVVAKTDSDGIADLFLPLTMPAGVKTLTVTYAGDAEVGATRATKAFTVVAEKTILRATAITGGAQATVVDDDKHVVVGRYVRFTVGTKSYLRKTSSRGVAVLTGVRKGTAIKVAFLPVRGYYLGTPTYTVRAR